MSSQSSFTVSSSPPTFVADGCSMRLRLRLGPATHKVEVPDSSTLKDLEEHVAAELTHGVKPVLGLNKTAATLVDGSTRLAELGVRQGDLLFVQNSADVPCPSGAPVARDAEGSVAALPDHLRRVLAEAGPVTCPHYALLLAAHAALLESGLEPAWPAGTSQCSLPSECTHAASGALQYRLRVDAGEDGAAAPAPVLSCTVRFTRMGGFLLVAGALDGGAVHQTVLGAVEHAPGGQLADARALWVRLKDELALRLAAALCAAAGGPSAPALLLLPSELKQRCLALLQPRDLAMAACVCAELRHAASADELWKPLFDSEFGDRPPAPASGRQGWKGAFGACWATRARQRRQRRRLAGAPLGGPLAPFPFGGTMRAPPHPGFQGITGGDVDRLPQPFLGFGGLPGVGGGGVSGLPGSFGPAGRRGAFRLY